jgi:hypothetical protein
MDRIEIKIKDNKDFGDVAFLVDKLAFLEVINFLRNKWKIKQLLTPNNYKDWEQKLYDECLESLEEFQIDVRDLRIKFNRPETFDNVIAHSIVCGSVPNGIYKSTYWQVVLDVPNPVKLQSKTSRVAIFITPQSQLEQVKKLYKEIKTKYFKSDDEYGAFFNTYNKDEIPNIKRDRNWYWKNKIGESYFKIALKDTKKELAYKEAQKASKHRGDYLDKEWKKYNDCLEYVEHYSEMVRKAVERYKKALTYT